MKIASLLLLAFTASVQAQTPAQLAKQITTLQAQVATLQGQLNKLAPLASLAPYVAVDFNVENGVKAPNVTFHGVNVHIVNDSGSTAQINGLGNLIIGYDEVGPTPLSTGERNGSHNLVMGSLNKFNAWSFSGIVNGQGNLIGAQECVVLTGTGNQCTGNFSPIKSAFGVIVGGNNNTIFNSQDSVVVGGVSNYISSIGDVILGGNNNTNGGLYSTILGGEFNQVQTVDGVIDQGIIIPDLPNRFNVKLPLH
jgi:hypothetical protein